MEKTSNKSIGLVPERETSIVSMNIEVENILLMYDLAVIPLLPLLAIKVN